MEEVVPLVVITGPTASGKTSLAIRLAKEFDGEIICADSRTIYRGMDIGTAKPTQEDQSVVPHWGLDLVNPGDDFSVADFKKYANSKIDEIRSRGHVPFLVGGTGLYIDAVIFDFQFGLAANQKIRSELSELSIEELQNYCIKNNIILPDNNYNKRYLIRAIERSGQVQQRREAPLDDTIVVGITTNKERLRTRIELRAEQIINPNVVKEATYLANKYGWDSEAMTGNVYRLVRKFIENEIDQKQLKDKFVISDWRLAKRQMTWLRRNPYILWADLKSAEHYLSDRLANK